jgi:hypothetical protein
VVTKAAALMKHESRPAPRPQPESQNFPTVSYQNCWLESVRWDLTEARKGSSYAKHCILLIAFAVEIGSEKIPLPAPAY